MGCSLLFTSNVILIALMTVAVMVGKNLVELKVVDSQPEGVGLGEQRLLYSLENLQDEL